MQKSIKNYHILLRAWQIHGNSGYHRCRLTIRLKKWKFVSVRLVSSLRNIFNISWPKTPLPEKEGVGGRVITFGDNRTNNHPHPVSPPQVGGNKAGSFIKIFLKHYTS
jgi:hypothetical protein